MIPPASSFGGSSQELPLQESSQRPQHGDHTTYRRLWITAFGDNRGIGVAGETSCLKVHFWWQCYLDNLRLGLSAEYAAAKKHCDHVRSIVLQQLLEYARLNCHIGVLDSFWLLSTHHAASYMTHLGIFCPHLTASHMLHVISSNQTKHRSTAGTGQAPSRSLVAA